MKKRQSFIFGLVCIISIFLNACNEFENNQFTTFLGAIVDEDGRPVAGIELIFLESPEWWDQERRNNFKRIIYEHRTNVLGEFRFVVPTRNRNGSYGIGVLEPNQLVFERSGEVVVSNVFPVYDWERDSEGINNVGLIELRSP